MLSSRVSAQHFLHVGYVCTLDKVIYGLKPDRDSIVNWGKYSRAGLESISEFRVYGKLKYLNSNKMQNNSYLQKFDQNLTRTQPGIDNQS